MLSDLQVDRQFPTSSAPVGSVDDVIDMAPLLATHPADRAAECAAFLTLSRTLASQPDSLAQRLVQCALELTHSQAAGLTLQETVDGECVLRWAATAGSLTGQEGRLMPRRLSPCGDVLDRRQALLMHDPARYYPCVRDLPSLGVNVLLVPFGDAGNPVGTIWIVAHESTFDGEDLRVVQELAAFASDLTATAAICGALQASEKRKQELLEASETRRVMLDAWLQHAPGVVIHLRGPQHVVTMVNDVGVTLLGARDLLELPIAQALPGRAGEGLAQLLDIVRATATPSVIEGLALELWTAGQPQPEMRYLDLVAQPVEAEDGTVAGIIVQGHDVTEQHGALERLRQADQRKDEFLAVLAHELRNPLSPILNCTQILKATANRLDARQAKAVQVIERQTATLTRLVDELLDVARASSGKIGLQFGLVVLQDVAEQACESCQPLLVAKNHRLEVIASATPLIVCGDHVRLVQVACNLLTNAAKYTPPGGQLRMELTADATWTVLRVTDTGLGIPAHLLPRVFDLFMQVPGTSSHAGGGLGLGLALVKQLVELHGGSVEACSPGANAGTTMVVRLPTLQ